MMNINKHQVIAFAVGIAAGALIVSAWLRLKARKHSDELEHQDTNKLSHKLNLAPEAKPVLPV